MEQLVENKRVPTIHSQNATRTSRELLDIAFKEMPLMTIKY